MCCYYNPTPRTDDPEHVHGAVEEYREEDRRAMTDLIQTLSRPAIHYKLLAAGRNDPEQAFAYCRARMRPQDLACIGVFTGDDPRMLETDVRLFERHAGAAKQTGAVDDAGGAENHAGSRQPADATPELAPVSSR